jgi:hypothetical protein
LVGLPRRGLFWAGYAKDEGAGKSESSFRNPFQKAQLKILLSVPAISLFIFSRWRTITIIGITTAAISSGHKLAKFQAGVSTIIKTNARGKATEAMMEASEIYRHNKTTTTHIKKAAEAQIV